MPHRIFVFLPGSAAFLMRASGLLLMVFLSGFRLPHPYYLSMTELEFNPGEKQMEMAVRMFTDDLEAAIRPVCRCAADLNRPDTREALAPQVYAYVTRNLKVRADGSTLGFKPVGMEKEEESTWVFLEAPLAVSPSGVQVNNSLLYDTRQQQINFVRYRAPGTDQTRQVRNPDTFIRF